MKQTFALLTILLIFTSQVFGQVKTINKDGKAIILNDDETKIPPPAVIHIHRYIVKKQF